MRSEYKAAAIAVRRAPTQANRPGFIGIDSLHQDNLHGRRGVYDINAVDCVTHWEISVELHCAIDLLSIDAERLRRF